ncbi:MAG: nuclear transport factor 2 family protein [Pseudomonadota bacterium]|nr:nuclear transport factor 2 family protein [Pseudomonadota bacterium]MEE3100620.1 nuclear transport factor 2 family protein [Pseudomonadota bacterium]
MSIAGPVMDLFDALETGKGWETCRRWCAPDASFACQAKSLEEVKTLEGYAEWMKALCVSVPDAHYDLKHHAVTADGATVLAFAVFLGTAKTKAGDPVPIAADYVYSIETEGGLVRHVTKIWNDRRGA